MADRDTQAAATALLDLCKAKKLMLATAESCTGGGVAQAITEVAGSSAWFERGFVTYSNRSKQQMLGVNESTLMQHGAVSEATAREMVTGALQHSEAQVALAVSGIAGPDGGTPDKPVGTVWVAVAGPDDRVDSRRINWPGARDQVRALSSWTALAMVLRALRGGEV